MNKDKKLTILIIEDDVTLSDSLRDILSFHGHIVDAYENVDWITDYSIFEKYSIIILDLNLPGENGIGFLQKLRKADVDTTVIIHTANVKSNDIGLGYKSGADIYIPKPSSMNEILFAISSIQNRTNYNFQENSISIKIDLNKNLLLAQDKKVLLTTEQTMLLVAFIRAKENILETWQISELMGLDLDNLNIATIQLRISRLRKKILAIVPNEPSIKAIRRFGYKLMHHFVIIK